MNQPMSQRMRDEPTDEPTVPPATDVPVTPDLPTLRDPLLTVVAVTQNSVEVSWTQDEALAYRIGYKSKQTIDEPSHAPDSEDPSGSTTIKHLSNRKTR